MTASRRPCGSSPSGAIVPIRPALMARVERRLRPWLAEFDAAPSDMVPLEWMADLIDFQQPWLDGHSRRVAAAALKALTLRLI